MNFIIKRIEERDYDDLIALFNEFAAYQNHPELMLNTAAKMKKEKDYFDGFIVRDEAGKAIAYTVFSFAYYTWTGKTLYMDDLYIKEEYRRQGLGRLLIEKVRDYAKETGCFKLRWQVGDWNHAARQFYKSLGATIDDVERNCDLILD